MSVQIFLHGKLLGIEPFLFGSGPRAEVLFGRSRWVTLLTEVMPRALLRQLNLSPLLLGTAGGGEFLVVLPSEMREAADDLLTRAGADIAALSAGELKLIWTSTENLGEWPIVRKRLADGMTARRGAPGLPGEDAFAPLKRSRCDGGGHKFAGGGAKSTRPWNGYSDVKRTAEAAACAVSASHAERSPNCDMAWQTAA